MEDKNIANCSSADEIMVSVVCNTYNQEDYIAEALESFIMQKTNFKFEILVHDDASDDRTADIVREYEKKYPELIKPVYQTENQYSKRNGMITKIQYGRAKGKYIAFCEGDDYWTDENKLQKQVDFLEANPEYSLCAHEAKTVRADTKELMFIIKASETDRDLNCDEIILKWGDILTTNSYMYRKALREEYPEYLKTKAPVGDYPITVYMAFKGKIRYMADNMSAYRYMAKGSWSSKYMAMNAEAKKNRINFLMEFEDMLKWLDNYSDYKYHGAFEKKLLINSGELVEYLRDYGDKALYRQRYSELPIRKKITHQIKHYIPFSIDIYNIITGNPEAIVKWTKRRNKK